MSLCQTQKAQDTVHRRPYLVGHFGQEVCLRPALLMGLIQFLLQLLPDGILSRNIIKACQITASVLCADHTQLPASCPVSSNHPEIQL